MLNKSHHEWESKMKRFIYSDLQSLPGGYFENIGQSQETESYQDIFEEILRAKG